jgi:hypothetical protein
MRRMLYLPVFLFLSCATVVSGPKQTLMIDSDPPAADASLTCADGTVQRGVTPFTAVVARRAGECSISVVKDGYPRRTVTLEKDVNHVYWANFATIPVAILGVAGVNGILYSRPTASSRVWGTGCLLVAAAAWIVDRHTGAMWKYEQPAKIVLQRKE